MSQGLLKDLHRVCCPVEEREPGSLLDPFVLTSQMLGLQVYATMSGSSSSYVRLLLLLKALDEYIFLSKHVLFKRLDKSVLFFQLQVPLKFIIFKFIELWEFVFLVCPVMF